MTAFRKHVFICSVLLSVAIVNGWPRIDPLVDSNVGLIKGLKAKNGNFSMFMGIPYAKVNESNPFGIAEPYPEFREPFEAYDDSAVCPQIDGTLIGSLDCLHLNIYVPSSATFSNKLPVMVWIHGGGFASGSAGRQTYGPEFLVRHDVIVVTINYRVGPYGFMCLNHPEIPGNQGLKDQALAFEWIKENIGAFGGDEHQITLFGESAGGHAIDLHLKSQKELLYNRVIIQSGSSEASTVLIEPDEYAPMKISEFLGHKATNIVDALQFLTKSEPHLVVAAAAVLGMEFKPCAEKVFEGVQPFITKRWANAMVPKVSKIPVLIGYNDKEMMLAHLFGGPEHFENLNIFRQLLNQTFNFDEETLSEMSRIVRNFYLGDEPPSSENKWDIIDFHSDFVYIHPTQRSVRKFLESGAGEIYYYQFSYAGGRNFVKSRLNITEPGAAHADELGYLFNIPSLSTQNSEEDMTMLDQMTTMWTNFVKFGNPTPGVTDLLPVKWLPLTKNTYNYMKLDRTLSMSRRPLQERMAFWDLFYELNKKAQKYYEPKTKTACVYRH